MIFSTFVTFTFALRLRFSSNSFMIFQQLDFFVGLIN
nr:MAG TPA: hypothetical protein [Caudoviricetes sp.]